MKYDLSDGVESLKSGVRDRTLVVNGGISLGFGQAVALVYIDRNEVVQLVEHLKAWLNSGSLKLPEVTKPPAYYIINRDELGLLRVGFYHGPFETLSEAMQQEGNDRRVVATLAEDGWKIQATYEAGGWRAV